MKQVLAVIDMQVDFVNGSLGTKEAEGIVQNVVKKIQNWDGPVYATRDTHEENYLETQEGTHLPVVHCVRNTPGWEIVPEVAAALKEKHSVIIDKPTFGSLTLAEQLKMLNQKEPISIELIGLCTDICVVSNALLLKANMPEVPISVDASCCAGVTPASHQAAIETMRSCQIKVLNGNPD